MGEEMRGPARWKDIRARGGNDVADDRRFATSPARFGNQIWRV